PPSGLPLDLPSFPTRRSSDLALLGCEVERRRFAFRRGACDGAPVLIEQGERYADSRDQRSRSGGAFRADGESELPDKVGAFGNQDRKSTRLNSSHLGISYAVF